MHARRAATARRPPSARDTGFTLVELVMVMVVIGVMAVFVVPRALDLGDWRLRAFGDELQAQGMAMQRLALTQRRPVVATITPTGASFAYVAGGTLVSLPCPAANSPCISETGSRTVTFNAANSGRATTSTGSALPVTVAWGDWSRRFIIEAETGLFRPLP
jgi:prepilin-type N-terminal cleavage/methylation domain-containing protein